MQRSLEQTGTASKFGELIDKHGRNDWLEPLMDDLGPYIQLQLGDIANMLEVFSNFYHWKSPRKTYATLSFFASCLAVSLFADMAFCMKILWFISGGSFFLCWPIASVYPKYRYLVSPFKWVLWDIPTNAEWSFQYLRRQAQITREELIKQKVEEGHSRELANLAIDSYTGKMKSIPKIHIDGDISGDSLEDSSGDEDWQSTTSTTSVLEASDIRSFRARYCSNIGRFIVFSNGVRFVKSIKKAETWRVLFVELTEMRKIEGNRLSKLVSSPDQLEIKCMDGRTIRFEGMRKRDEAFNTIIAFSGLQWQSLQIRHNTDEQEP